MIQDVFSQINEIRAEYNHVNDILDNERKKQSGIEVIKI